MCLPLGVLSSSARLACLASNSVLGRQTALEVVGNFFQPLSVSDNVESNETIEAAPDRTGDVQSSLSLQVQEMTRWAIKRKILYLGIYPIMDNTQKNPNSLEQAFRKHNHIVLDKEDLEVGRTIRVRSDWLHWNQPSLDAFPTYYVTVALLHQVTSGGAIFQLSPLLVCLADVAIFFTRQSYGDVQDTQTYVIYTIN